MRDAPKERRIKKLPHVILRREETRLRCHVILRRKESRLRCHVILRREESRLRCHVILRREETCDFRMTTKGRFFVPQNDSPDEILRGTWGGFESLAPKYEAR